MYRAQVQWCGVFCHITYDREYERFLGMLVEKGFPVGHRSLLDEHKQDTLQWTINQSQADDETVS